MSEFDGNCFRCTEPGHWHDDPACPLLRKARTPAEHEKRIAGFGRRFTDNQLSRARKTEFIKDENRIWRGKAASLA